MRAVGGCACEAELEGGQHKQRVLPFTERRTAWTNTGKSLGKAAATAGKMCPPTAPAAPAGSSSGAHPTETPNTSSTAPSRMRSSRKWGSPQNMAEEISPRRTWVLFMSLPCPHTRGTQRVITFDHWTGHKHMRQGNH